MEMVIVVLLFLLICAGLVYGGYKFFQSIDNMRKLIKDIIVDFEQLADQVQDLEREMITEDNLDMNLRDFRSDLESMEQELNDAEENRDTLYNWLGLLHSAVEEVTLRANMDRNTREEILEALKEIRAKF